MAYTLILLGVGTQLSQVHAQVQAETQFQSIPLVRIETRSGLFPPVKSKDKIPARVLIIENPDPKEFSCQTSSASIMERENVTDITVRVRGNITRYYPKKGHQINFVQGENLDEDRSVSLLGLSESDSWALVGPYYDRSLFRNALAMDLGRQLHSWYVPRYRFVELMLNCHYKGIYTLIEKIERAKTRVPIDKFDWEHPETSPFMLKRDGKGFGVSEVPGETFTTKWGTRLTHVYPSDNKMSRFCKEEPEKYNQAMQVMKSSVEELEDIFFAMNSRNPKDEEWERLIDVPSFVAFILMQEISKNIDGFRRSVFFYRDDQGKFNMGPIWDFDTSFGNLWFYNQHKTHGFQHGHGKYFDGNSELFWFKKLLKSPRFAAEVVRTYREMRKPGGAFHQDNLNRIFDSYEKGIPPEAIKRNFRKWKVLGRPPLAIFFVPPPYPKTHGGEVKRLRKWVDKRMHWLDRHIGSLL